uniref:ATARD1 n=1 Tax=Arundo donax TaxID=35708 RepID=A0A0A9F5P4_ARUDO
MCCDLMRRRPHASRGLHHMCAYLLFGFCQRLGAELTISSVIDKLVLHIIIVSV